MMSLHTNFSQFYSLRLLIIVPVDYVLQYARCVGIKVLPKAVDQLHQSL